MVFRYLPRVRARICWHFGAGAGRAAARRRDAGDVMTSSRSANAVDARPPPRPEGLRLPGLANYRSWLVMIQLGIGAAAKCQIILARALKGRVRRSFLSSTIDLRAASSASLRLILSCTGAAPQELGMPRFKMDYCAADVWSCTIFQPPGNLRKISVKMPCGVWPLDMVSV